MSWFQDLAGKAENILNKIDQNAATVLHHQKTEQLTDDETTKQLTGGTIDVKNALAPQSMSRSASSSSLRDDRQPPIIPKNMLSLKKSPAIKRPPPPPDNEGVYKIDTDALERADKTPTAMSSSTSTSRCSSISSRGDRTTVIDADQSAATHPTSATFVPNGVDPELAALKIVLNEIKIERDECKDELETLREHINNANTRSVIKELETLCEQLRDEQDSLRHKNESLEKSNFNYVKSISDLETKLSKLHHSETDLRGKLEWAKQEVEQANYELQQYRARAQSTLQMKEKLIEQLKLGGATIDEGTPTNGPAEASSSSSSPPSTHSIEMEHLKAENVSLLDEIRCQNDQHEQIRRYVDRLEAMQKDQQHEFDGKLRDVNENLRSEELKWRQYEAENKVQLRELAMLRDEMSRIQSDYASQLHKRESELAKLRSQVPSTRVLSSSVGTTGQSNIIEERIHSLTQSLVQKQNSLETVTADRNALRLQLEKIELQTGQTIAQLRQQRPHVINVNDTDDAKAQVPMFFQETPFDTRVARRVKRVYSTLDSMGVRLGVFLRRYPLIRILTIFYVVLLHLWVMVVLCSSTPN